MKRTGIGFKRLNSGDEKAERFALTVDALDRKKAGAVRLVAFGNADVVPQRIPFGAPEHLLEKQTS